jgi:hypothetical protein
MLCIFKPTEMSVVMTGGSALFQTARTGFSEEMPKIKQLGSLTAIPPAPEREKETDVYAPITRRSGDVLATNSKGLSQSILERIGCPHPSRDALYSNEKALPGNHSPSLSIRVLSTTLESKTALSCSASL